jgi:NADPH:quinone reductase-like Zn-dependent oxidoreductase
VQIGDTTFEDAAALSTIYACMSALFLHLGLERPSSKASSKSIEKKEKILIWGISSSFGALSAQLAQDAGYVVVGVASGRHANLATNIGVSHFVDRISTTVIPDLIALGPYKAVLAAADSAEDQIKIGEVMAAHGGGQFLSTMGVRDGVKLPDGVTGFFKQFLDDYIDPKNEEFTRWVWWDYLEAAFADGRLKSLPLELKGGLSKVVEAWLSLREEGAGGKRLIISPELD